MQFTGSVPFALIVTMNFPPIHETLETKTLRATEIQHHSFAGEQKQFHSHQSPYIPRPLITLVATRRTLLPVYMQPTTIQRMKIANDLDSSPLVPLSLKLATIASFLRGERIRQAVQSERARQARLLNHGGQATIHVSSFVLFEGCGQDI